MSVSSSPQDVQGTRPNISRVTDPHPQYRAAVVLSSLSWRNERRDSGKRLASHTLSSFLWARLLHQGQKGQSLTIYRMGSLRPIIQEPIRFTPLLLLPLQEGSLMEVHNKGTFKVGPPYAHPMSKHTHTIAQLWHLSSCCGGR